MIFVGVDWAEAHHDVAVQDSDGRRLAKARLPEGVEGITRFRELVAQHAGEPGDVVTGIETDRDLFVAAAVLARYARNQRPADAIYLWAFPALSTSPGARTFHDQRRAAGSTHHQALRAVGNRLAGILHGCLAHHTRYNENTAWARRTPALTATAA